MTSKISRRAGTVLWWAMVGASSMACSNSEKPTASAKSNPDTDAGLVGEVESDAPGEDALRSDTPVEDVVADDSGGDTTAAAGDGGETQADAAADGGDTAVADSDSGSAVEPDVHGDDDVPIPISVSQVCNHDGVPPGPTVGSPCTTQGERRCVNLKMKVHNIGMDPKKVHYNLCARPYFVECGKSAQGKLVWQPPQTCAGPGVSPKSTSVYKKCNTAPNVLYHKFCRPGVAGSAHFCCPNVGSANHANPLDYGRVVCHPGWTGYSQALSYNQISVEDWPRLSPETLEHLQACSGPVHNCVYWLMMNALPKERIFCVDPKKKPVKDQYGQFKPVMGEWLKPICIKVSDTRARFAKTCKESGYNKAPGGP